jgi:hypothetical protein
MSESSKNLCVATVLVALAWGGACAIKDGGLGSVADGGSKPATGGSGGTAVCPAGLIDQASWPAGTTYTSCTQTCGPDGIGVKTCGQTDLATCQAASGCVCSPLAATCVTCAPCSLPSASGCYLPTNADDPPDCAVSVAKGATCGSACDKRLCIQADGKTGCVCNAESRFACAIWGGTAWK